MIEIISWEGVRNTKKASLLFTCCCTWRVRKQNTYITQCERREEEKREADLSRFGGSEPVMFM
jgi:hypothetical protein